MMWSQYDMMSDMRKELKKQLAEVYFYGVQEEIKELEENIKSLDEEMAEFIQEKNRELES